VNSCLDRPAILASVDDDGPPEDRERARAHLLSCLTCRDVASRAVWEVGLFLMADPGAEAAVPGPSAGFTARLMAAVREAPRAPAAPEPRLRLVPPEPSPVPPPRPVPWGLWAGVAAAAGLAASIGFLLLRGEPEVIPEQRSSQEMGKGVVVARGGGVLRWTGPFDGSFAGSDWIAKGASSPPSPGEILHSPAPSSVQLRMPEGSRLEAGSPSWLAVGRGDEIAVLDGAITASAGPAGEGGAGGSLTVEAPGLRAVTGGEIEVSVRTPGGVAGPGSAAWLGGWRSERLPGVAAVPAVPAAVPLPRSTVVVFARKGAASVHIVAAAGPVRNSVERVVVPQGHALVLVAGKVYPMLAVDDDAPPERAGWLPGMPVPPDSQFFGRFRGGLLAPAEQPEGPLMSGPVRNSVERTLGDPDPEARAYALSVAGSMGGAEAVAAAVKAAGDPTVLVRSAAVRVLALNAWADRARALEALRRLAKDRDAGVAVFAIVSLKALADRDAIPVLLGLVAVDDDAPTEVAPGVDDDGPPEAARVYAFDALVAFGDASLVDRAAALAPKVAGDPNLAGALSNAVSAAFVRLDKEALRAYLPDARPGVRAATLGALGDADAARAALADPSEFVRVAAVRVLGTVPGPLDLEVFRPLLSGTEAVRWAVVESVSTRMSREPAARAPDWLRETALALLRSPGARASQYLDCLTLLRPDVDGALQEEVLARGDPGQVEALLLSGAASPEAVLRALGHASPAVRGAAAFQLSALSSLAADRLPTVGFVRALRAFRPGSADESRWKGSALSALVRARNSSDALDALVAMTESPTTMDHVPAIRALAACGQERVAADSLVHLLGSAIAPEAEEAANSLLIAAGRTGWAGPRPASLFPSTSPHPLVQARIALAAGAEGAPGAAEALRAILDRSGSRVRLAVLRALRKDDTGWAGTVLVRTVLEDPDPRVRLEALLRLQGDPLTEACRRCASDPSVWAQGTALSHLANAGDSAALDSLRALLRGWRNRAAKDAELLRSVDPEAPDVADRFLRAAGMAALAEGGVESLVGDEDAVRWAVEALSTRARCLADARLLRESSDPQVRAAAARDLGSLRLAEAFEALCLATRTADQPDARVRDEAARALEAAVGFRPARGWEEFRRHHPNGYVSPLEIHSAEVR
jgi:HEAT repeat protein